MDTDVLLLVQSILLPLPLTMSQLISLLVRRRAQFERKVFAEKLKNGTFSICFEIKIFSQVSKANRMKEKNYSYGCFAS